MLVLTRKRSETICIGDEIKIKILDICGDRVRIGVIADKSIPVHREEIWERCRAEGEKGKGKD